MSSVRRRQMLPDVMRWAQVRSAPRLTSRTARPMINVPGAHDADGAVSPEPDAGTPRVDSTSKRPVARPCSSPGQSGRLPGSGTKLQDSRSGMNNYEVADPHKHAGPRRLPVVSTGWKSPGPGTGRQDEPVRSEPDSGSRRRSRVLQLLLNAATSKAICIPMWVDKKTVRQKQDQRAKPRCRSGMASMPSSTKSKAAITLTTPVRFYRRVHVETYTLKWNQSDFAVF